VTHADFMGWGLHAAKRFYVGLTGVLHSELKGLDKPDLWAELRRDGHV
jgi:hypothetical protein